MRSENGRNRSSSSRKRSLAVIGVFSLLYISVEATPLRQHAISPTQRTVPYAHIGGSESSRSFSKFWIPLDNAQSRVASESSEPRYTRRRLGKGNNALVEDVYSHLIVDASQESVDEVFQELRHRRKNRFSSSSSPKGGLWSKLAEVNAEESRGRPWPWRHLLRRSTTEQSDRVSPSNLSSTPGFINVDFGSEKPEDQTEFNVTTGIEYDNDASSSSPSDNQNFTNSHNNNRTINSTTVIFTDSERLNQTNSSGGTFRPIRIRAFFSEVQGGGQFLTDQQHSMLLQDMLRPALLSWSAALRVDPVVGNLTVDAHQLIDGATCGPGLDSGLPSVPVPPAHMTEGVAHADMIVYLNVGFVEVGRNTTTGDAADLLENMTNHSDGGGNKKQKDMPLNSQPLTSWEEATLLRNASDAVKLPSCSGDYLAASAICSTDQYDRPTAAILHICIDHDFFNETSLRRNIVTMRHELAHSLGFNSLSLAHFRRTDGTPITPRNEKGGIPLTEVECTGPLKSRNILNVTLPSQEILQFRTVRGGVRVAEVVTPSVVQVVRNHFDCQELSGAELESGEFLPLSTDPLETACIGDHWERRLFKNDLLNPVVEDLEFNPRISTINLAYFADSGWYQVDLSRAAPAAGWGRASGCDFVQQTCINSHGQVPAKFQDSFCSDSPALDVDGYASEINGCTPDLTKKASCSIELYEGELPNEYQYFNMTYGSNVGGKDAFMDYCPVFSGFTNGLCSDPENEALIRVDRIERFGERNSRCIPGLLSARRTALCLRIACAVEDRSFHVQVDGVWRPCAYKDQILETANGDRVFCPDPIRVCPTFYCQRDCLGTDRVCNYTQGKCVCAGNCSESDGPESFYDPFENASSSLPDADSPLSDYYVPTSRVLRDESRFALESWQIVLISLGCAVAFGILVYWFYRRRRGNANLPSPGGDSNDSDNRAAAAMANESDPNKDKMLASVVVDLRMNTPSLRYDALQDRASETDLSVTDTDGGGTYVTDLSSDIHEGGFGIDDSPGDYVDPLAPVCVVRRRNIHDSR